METLRQRGRKLFHHVHRNHLRAEHGFLHSPIRGMSLGIAALHQATLHQFYTEQYRKHGSKKWSMEGTSDQCIQVWRLAPESSSQSLAATGNHVISSLSSGRFTKHPLCSVSSLYLGLMLLARKPEFCWRTNGPQRGRARAQGHRWCWSSCGQWGGERVGSPLCWREFSSVTQWKNHKRGHFNTCCARHPDTWASQYKMSPVSCLHNILGTGRLLSTLCKREKAFQLLPILTSEGQRVPHCSSSPVHNCPETTLLQSNLCFLAAQLPIAVE